eukprot:4797683-Alexandrium_andersonii.AAC.1
MGSPGILHTLQPSQSQTRTCDRGKSESAPSERGMQGPPARSPRMASRSTAEGAKRTRPTEQLGQA